MSAILCVAAMHLSVLSRQATKYSQASIQLMAKTVRLFRKNLSRPFTKFNCEALMGTALLVNFISWFDLGFLEDTRTTNAVNRLDLARNQLFLLTPGIIQVWFQAMPTFIDEGSVFTELVYQHPRLPIEETLAKRGEDPARFVEPLLRMWDDPRYQAGGLAAIETADREPASHAWHLLLGLEMQLSHHNYSSCAADPVPSYKMRRRNWCILEI